MIICGMILSSAKEQFRLLLLNPVLMSCISSWLCAQFLKTIINLVYGKIHSFTQLIEMLIWKTGGLPSSHSALVASLCTSIGFRHGLNSDMFIISLCFFLVVIRDAMGVRRSSGMQARKLNEIGRELDEKNIIEYIPLKEVDGHTPMEVILGCVLGFLVGLAFSLLK